MPPAGENADCSFFARTLTVKWNFVEDVFQASVLKQGGAKPASEASRLSCEDTGTSAVQLVQSAENDSIAKHFIANIKALSSSCYLHTSCTSFHTACLMPHKGMFLLSSAKTPQPTLHPLAMCCRCFSNAARSLSKEHRCLLLPCVLKLLW